MTAVAAAVAEVAAMTVVGFGNETDAVGESTADVADAVIAVVVVDTVVADTAVADTDDVDTFAAVVEIAAGTAAGWVGLAAVTMSAGCEAFAGPVSTPPPELPAAV